MNEPTVFTLMRMRMNPLAMSTWVYCYGTEQLMWLRRRRDLF